MARKDLIIVLSGDNSDLRKKLDQVKRDLSQLGQDLTAIGAKMSAAVTIPLLAAGGAALKLAGDYEQAQIAFETMLGSAAKSKAFLQDLEEFAKKTPFDFPGLVEASRRLIAMGFEADRVIPILRTVGDTAAATGKGAVGVDLITLALSQMRAKGKVSAEEMTRQLGQLIPAWDMLARSIGVSVPEAMKMAEQGMLSGAEAVDRILGEMAADYGGQMEKQMTTLLGLWDRAKDTFLIALRKMGTELTPMAKQIVEGFVLPMVSGVEKAVAAFAKLPVGIQTGVAALAVLGAATGPVLFAIGQISLGISAVMTMKGPLLALFTSTIPAGIAAMTNFGRALVLLAGSYITTLVSSLAAARAGFLAFTGALAAGNFAGALTMAQGALAGFAATIGSVLLPALAAAGLAFAGWNIGKWAADNIRWVGAVGDAFAGLVVKFQQFTGTGAWGQAAQASQELEFQVTKLAEALEKKGVVVDRGNMSLMEYSKALREAGKEAGVVKVETNDIGKAMALLDTLTKNAGDTAKAAIDKLTQAFKEGKITQEEYNKYLAKYKGLAADAVKPTKDLKDTFAELVTKGWLVRTTLDALNLTMLAYEVAVDKGKQAWKDLSAELTEGNRTLKEQAQALNEAVQSWVAFNPELAKAVASLTAIKNPLEGVSAEALQAAENYGEFVTTVKKDAVTAVETLRTKIATISQELKNQNLTVAERVALQASLNAAQEELNQKLGVEVKTNQRLLELWRGIEGAVRQFGSSLVDALLDGASLGQAFVTMLKDIARTILDTVVQGAIDVMKDSILQAVSATDLLTAGWKKFFGVVGVGSGGSKSPGTPGIPGSGGAEGGLGGLTGVINMITGIAQLITGIFQSFQFAAMNKTLDLIEREVRESKIHLGYILEAMHTYMGENQWQRHEAIKEFWGQQLAKMDALILAVQNIRVSTGSIRGNGREAPAEGTVVTLVDWADATKTFVTDELRKAADVLMVPLDAVRHRLDAMDLDTLRGWIVPELEKQSGILTGIYLQLSTLGAGSPEGEWIPNMTLAPATASGLTVNISGAMKQGQYHELLQREMEAFGIPH